MPMPTVLNPYMHHENVLKCVDTIIYAFFAVQKKKAWSVAATGFIAPDHETYHDGYRWRVLSEQSHSMSMLIPTQNQDTDDALADAEVLIAEAQNQLDTRASVLRAYSQAIAKCAEQFSSGYGKRFAQHLRSTILQHWSAASYADVSSASDHAATSVEETPRTAPFATFAGVTRAANETQPGNRKITPKDTPRRKAQAPRNNKRALIRLRKDLEFFNKSLKV
ncbi:hypothetical protein NHJ13734_000558 [Beauveria thailandica]